MQATGQTRRGLVEAGEIELAGPVLPTAMQAVFTGDGEPPSKVVFAPANLGCGPEREIEDRGSGHRFRRAEGGRFSAEHILRSRRFRRNVVLNPHRRLPVRQVISANGFAGNDHLAGGEVHRVSQPAFVPGVAALEPRSVLNRRQNVTGADVEVSFGGAFEVETAAKR